MTLGFDTKFLCAWNMDRVRSRERAKSLVERDKSPLLIFRPFRERPMIIEKKAQERELKTLGVSANSTCFINMFDKER